MNRLVEALLQSYVGESQARNRYSYYSKIARKEGYIQLAEIFEETANQELTHGKTFYRLALDLLKAENQEMDMAELEKVAVPLMYGDSIANLKESIKGEAHEHSVLYPNVAKIAEEMGHPEIAKQVRAIAEAEAHHEKRYKTLLEKLENGTLFKRKEKVWWYCQKCGYWHYGEEPPEKCPACGHPTGYFKRLEEEF